MVVNGRWAVGGVVVVGTFIPTTSVARGDRMKDRPLVQSPDLNVRQTVGLSWPRATSAEFRLSSGLHAAGNRSAPEREESYGRRADWVPERRFGESFRVVRCR